MSTSYFKFIKMFVPLWFFKTFPRSFKSSISKQCRMASDGSLYQSIGRFCVNRFPWIFKLYLFMNCLEISLFKPSKAFSYALLEDNWQSLCLKKLKKPVKHTINTLIIISFVVVIIIINTIIIIFFISVIVIFFTITILVIIISVVVVLSITYFNFYNTT